MVFPYEIFTDLNEINSVANNLIDFQLIAVGGNSIHRNVANWESDLAFRFAIIRQYIIGR